VSIERLERRFVPRHVHEMGCRAVDGDRPDCLVADCLLFEWLFRTRFLSAYLGIAARFWLCEGSLSLMPAGLVAQDSHVRDRPHLDSIYQRGRDGFICLPPMPFGYWYWTEMSRMPCADMKSGGKRHFLQSDAKTKHVLTTV
jgi:hypothetical protein